MSSTSQSLRRVTGVAEMPQISARISAEHRTMLNELAPVFTRRRPTMRRTIELLIENEYARRFGAVPPG